MKRIAWGLQILAASILVLGSAQGQTGYGPPPPPPGQGGQQGGYPGYGPPPGSQKQKSQFQGHPGGQNRSRNGEGKQKSGQHQGQRPGHPGGPPPFGGPGNRGEGFPGQGFPAGPPQGIPVGAASSFVPPNPILEVLDTDQDGQLSPSEIENAVAALLTLDQDEDGTLAAEELRPQPIREEDGFVSRILSNDRDGDGKVSAEELPEHMKTLMERADLNEDGLIDSDEIEGMVSRKKSKLESDTKLEIEEPQTESGKE